MKQIFSSPAYTVTEHIPAEAREDVVMVTLANRMPEDGPRRPFAHHILAPLGYRTLNLVPASNDWYQSEGIEEALDAVRKRSRGEHTVGFAASMGAFGLVNYADLLGLDAALAFSPQFALERSLVPFETRCEDDAIRMGPFPRHRITTRPQPERLVVYYDDEYDLDTQQVDRIAEHLDFTRVPCPGAVHNVLGTWYRQRQLQEKVREAIEAVSPSRSCPDVFPRARVG
ncbi:hypothetical protein [Stappia indica]|uniref:Esterase n=1 Tax=Stappia indica TaxID=538381 RepID=A0A857C5N3_9HYPH|nr:hypothetical protein [Stappia indica]QGZ34199.1 hypothetical protein GH266_06535 [Stappia indica]